MGTTAFKTISAGIAAALSAAPSLASGRVYENRQLAVSSGSTDCIVVRIERSTADQSTISYFDWTTVFSIEIYARSAAGTDPQVAVDALLDAAWLRLSAIDAESIGAFDVTLNPDVQWLFDELDSPMACAVLHLGVRHRTTTAALQPA